MIFEEPLYDEIPLFISDNRPEEEGLEFSYPEEARDLVLIIDQVSIDKILKELIRLLHNSQPIVSELEAVEERDIKGKRLFLRTSISGLVVVHASQRVVKTFREFCS